MSNGKILVVDDDKNICELLGLYLENEGYNVYSVNDGESAVREFQTFQPDLVILDKDPTAIPPETIKDIKVEETIVGGKTVYRRA